MTCCKKNYVLPKFPLAVKIFTGTMIGTVGALRITTVGQLVFPEHNTFYDNTLPNNIVINLAMKLLLPKQTDLRCPKQGNLSFSDWVEVPALSGRYYMVCDFDDKWKGFTTEHRIAYIRWVFGVAPQIWPIPTP